MRLRNIPRAGNVLNKSPFVVKNAPACKGIWAQKIFHNSNPIHIEIGMGKGQFLLSLAARDPNINFIGIERYSSVLLRAVEKLTPDENADLQTIEISERADAGLQGTLNTSILYKNLRFLCIDAAEIESIFAPQEAARIYLNFSDPWPKAKHAKRRLTSPEYFSRYNHILAQEGQIEFKTDNRSLFDYSVQTIRDSDIWEVSACTYDLHHDPFMNAGNIMTEYEEKFSSMDNPICKLIVKRCPDSLSCIY